MVYEINHIWTADVKSSETIISQLWTQLLQFVEKPEKFRTSTGFEPVTSRFRCDALANWDMKQITLGAGHPWVVMVPWGMNQWWNGIWNESYMNRGCNIKWSYDLRSYERNFYNCAEKPEKFRTSTGFEAVTSQFRYDALTNWAMKPLTLRAGHPWVLMFPWGINQWWNGIWTESYMNCVCKIKWSYDLRSYERNFYNCVEKPEKFRTSTGFEPVTSRFRCVALTNWAMKPLSLGAGHPWVLTVPWGMNQW